METTLEVSLKVKPEILIEGDFGFTYICNSALPIEEILDQRKVLLNQYKSNQINLLSSNACHFFCKNTKCEIKENIVKLQNEYHKNMYCVSCSTKKVAWGFFLIINKFKVEDLLPDNFAFVCCTCYNEIGEENWEKLMAQ